MIKFIAQLSRKNKDIEAQVAAAMRLTPISATGGRTAARQLTFEVADRKEAVNARMRVYNLMKKLGECITVNMTEA